MPNGLLVFKGWNQPDEAEETEGRDGGKLLWLPRTSCHPPSHPFPSQRLSLSISKKEDATYLSFRIVLGIKKDQYLHMKTDGIEVIIKQLPMKK